MKQQTEYQQPSPLPSQESNRRTQRTVGAKHASVVVLVGGQKWKESHPLPWPTAGGVAFRSVLWHTALGIVRRGWAAAAGGWWWWCVSYCIGPTVVVSLCGLDVSVWCVFSALLGTLSRSPSTLFTKHSVPRVCCLFFFWIYLFGTIHRQHSSASHCYTFDFNGIETLLYTISFPSLASPSIHITQNCTRIIGTATLVGRRGVRGRFAPLHRLHPPLSTTFTRQCNRWWVA